MTSKSLSSLKISFDDMQNSYKLPSPKRMVWENMSHSKLYKLMSPVHSEVIDDGRQISFESIQIVQKSKSKEKNKENKKIRQIKQKIIVNNSMNRIQNEPINNELYNNKQHCQRGQIKKIPEHNMSLISCNLSQISMKNSSYENQIQITSNPFTKTKQLFKNKNPSLILDDLSKSNLFTIKKNDEYFIEKNIDQECIFEFDSFGKSSNELDSHPFLKKGLDSQSQKYWHSSSMEMDFQKIKPKQFKIDEQKQNIPERNMSKVQKNTNISSSVKQFCFKLNNENLSFNEIKDVTPKKISNKFQTKQLDTKSAIKKVIYDFIDNLEGIPTECITKELINQTQSILNQAVIQINKTERSEGKSFEKRKQSASKYPPTKKQNISKDQFKIYQTKKQIGKSKEKDTIQTIKTKKSLPKKVKTAKPFKF